ncbi:MAG: aminotransferase class I/II-fold pyridoxal phosphate-dependent enzyme [Chloroflexi bacterium]|nr:aminotransferase class I/II-fold pyridoxal phosphate-dependent enzyme [Chloroflexota bacterium]
MSKHLSLGGWRLGVAILPATKPGAQVMRAVRTIASETWSATTSPVQYAAMLAYSGHPDIIQYIDECANIHGIRTQYLWRGLTNIGIRCPQADGAFYLFPDFDRWREPLSALGIHTSAQLAVHLLETYQLATLPGSVFGSPPSQLSLRLSSSYLDMETNEQAEAVLTAYRSQIEPEQLMCEHHPNMNKALSRFQLFVENLSEIQFRMNGRMPEQESEGGALADRSKRVTSKDHRFE